MLSGCCRGMSVGVIVKLIAVLLLSLVFTLPIAQAQNFDFSFSPKSMPLPDCPLRPNRHCPEALWWGPGMQPAELIKTGLTAGMQIKIVDVNGMANWGGASGLVSPSSCESGPSASEANKPKLLAAFQFANDQKKVIDPGFPTPGGLSAFTARDMKGQTITVPAGATRLYVSFPDSKYSDNDEARVCTGTIWMAPQQPACSDGLDNDGDGRTDYPADSGCTGPNDDNETDVSQCGSPQGSVYKDYEGNQGPWKHVNWGGKAPTLVYSNLTAGDVVNVSNVTGTWSGRIHNNQDLLPQACTNAFVSFTNASNQAISMPHLDALKGDGIAVPSGATRMYVHILDAQDQYFDNSGNRDNRTPCRAQFTYRSCTAECTPGQQQSRGCATGLQGVCSGGTQTRTCGQNSHWGAYGNCVPQVQPGQYPEEISKNNCSDTYDNDCDGQTDSQDSGCRVCQPGQVEEQNCNSGLPGVCAGGKRSRTCNANGQWGAYGQCQATIQPGTQPEAGNCSDNKDNDCDGKVDTQDSDCFVCQPGQTETGFCNTGLPGVCSAGKRTRTCQANGTWGNYQGCNADITPGSQPEAGNCSDNKDNDCDGKVDTQDSDCYVCQPGQTQSRGCATGLPGVCSGGDQSRTCGQNGQWGSYGTCVPRNQPGQFPEEVAKNNCSDTFDNDCDGKTDSQDPGCQTECQPGQVEEVACSSGLPGVCSAGKKKRTCGANGSWGAFGQCQATIQPGTQPEAGNCSDNKDNDCDGKTDTQDSDCYVCQPGQVEEVACNSGLPGICSAGWRKRTCGANGTWGNFGACVGEINPGDFPEAGNCSDGKDNDCDGKTDAQDDDCQLAKPILIAPSGDITETMPTFSWNAVPNAISYELKVYQVANQPFFTQIVNGTSFKIPSNLALGSYWFRVTAINGSIRSEASDAMTFRIVAPAQCTPGQVEEVACSSGLPGVCSAGKKKRTCNAQGQWGAFGQCQANIQPGTQPEAGNCSDNKDNDCDGKTDSEDSDCYTCQPGQVEEVACSSGLPGICSAGKKKRTCGQNGQWGAFGQCQANIQPGTQPEAGNCSDNKDNDCDGQTDTQDSDCYTCQPGQVEEVACSSGLPGICSAGKKTRTCGQNGQWGAFGQCQATIQPGTQPEAGNCSDNKDNDCDGKTDAQDEDCRACQPGQTETVNCNSGLPGVCSAGKKTRTCNAQGQWDSYGQCVPNITPGSQPEVCNDGLDNDCNGKTDALDPVCADQCPNDPNKTEPGFCGCGNPETGDTKYSYTAINASNGTSPVIMPRVELSYVPASQTLGVQIKVKAHETHGTVPHGFQFAINSGHKPIGHDGEFAWFYFDASDISNPKLTVYAYNGAGAASWKDGSIQAGIQPPDKIKSSLVDSSFVKQIGAVQNADGTKDFSFSINAAAINAHVPLYPDAGGQPWVGAKFGAKLGLWLGTMYITSASYGQDGFLTALESVSLGNIDFDNKSTIQGLTCGECEPGEREEVACSSGLPGVCAAGKKVRVCGQDRKWGVYGQCQATIQPGTQPEVGFCSDSKDNDCDGKTDQEDPDCQECQPGQEEEQACNSGLPGVCQAGKRKRTCGQNGKWGQYGACVAGIQPGTQPEAGNCSDSKDNDCDGKTDAEDSDCFECQPGAKEEKACQTGLPGVCSVGWQIRTCGRNGKWGDFGACEASIKPGTQPEAGNCSDNKDNDCDGKTDAEDPDCYECQPNAVEEKACTTNLPGVCASGKQKRTCGANGKWGEFGACEATIKPGTQPEAGNCSDSKDNDCDGKTDAEDSDCYECQPAAVEEVECVTTHPGLCSAGKKKRTCGANGKWGEFGACDATIQPGTKPEAGNCTDGKDNDCDGKVDAEDSDCFECQPAAVEEKECDTKLPGVCAVGKQKRTCTDSGKWGEYSACEATIQPGSQPEAGFCADGKDNDCDGKTDNEDSDCFECNPGQTENRVCSTGLTGACAEGSQSRTCGADNKWSAFSECQPQPNCDDIDYACTDLLTNTCTSCIVDQLSVQCSSCLLDPKVTDKSTCAPCAQADEQCMPCFLASVDPKCVNCESVDQAGANRTLDGNIAGMGRRVVAVARILSSTAKNKADKEFAKEAKQQATLLQNQGWTFAWQLPSIISSCSTSLLCTEQSLVATKQQVENSVAELRALLDEVVLRLGNRKGKKAKVAGKKKAAKRKEANANKKVQEFNEMYDELLATLKGIPDTSDNCKLK